MIGNHWRLPCLLLVTASAVGATDYLLDPHRERLPALVCWGIFLAAWTTVVVSWRTHRPYLRRWSGGATLGVVLAEVIAVSWVHFAFFPCPLRPNTPEEQQFVNLMVAVNNNDLGSVRNILAQDKNPDFLPPHDHVTEASSTYYNDGRSPLQIAVSCGTIEIAKALIDHGASPAQGNPCLLAQAAQTGDIPMMRMLIAKGAPVNDFGDEGSREAIAGAMATGTPVWQVIKSSSALWAAVEEEKPEAVEFLLAHGANPCTCKADLGYENNFANVMQLARSTDNIRIAKMLKGAGATE